MRSTIATEGDGLEVTRDIRRRHTPTFLIRVSPARSRALAIERFRAEVQGVEPRETGLPHRPSVVSHEG